MEIKALRNYVETLFNSYSEILFLQSPLVGFVFFVLTMLNPGLGASGLLSVLISHSIARFLGMKNEELVSGFYTYNALLVGLSIGYMYSLTGISIIFICLASILTFFVSYSLNTILNFYFRLPVLSVPFVIISSLVYLSSYQYSNLLLQQPLMNSLELPFGMPIWIEGYLRSLGAILFYPNTVCGLIIALALLYASRIVFLLTVGGYLVGTFTKILLMSSSSDVFLSQYNFNYILIALALGGIFLVPSPRTYLLAAIAVASSTLVLDASKVFWSSYGLPVFTLPFNLVTLSVLYCLKTLKYPFVAQQVCKSPEKTIETFIENKNRKPIYPLKLNLPFSGEWAVWQGFNGEWTHKGVNRYAYDFVMTKNGETHSGAGLHLSDYYAYEKPVLSPCRGRVVKVIDGLPDNSPGQTDSVYNWGNCIVIDSALGYFVEISHFAAHTIQVAEGQWVEVGLYLGLCGNSGYSPQPHIHIQTQALPGLGSETVPFCFQSYQQDRQFIPHGLPALGQVVEALSPTPIYRQLFSFVVDQKFCYEIIDQNTQERQDWSYVIKINAVGEMFMATHNGQLFFSKDYNHFYFYGLQGNDPYLKLLYQSMPMVPLCHQQAMYWRDKLPKTLFVRIAEKIFLQMQEAFIAHNSIVNIQLRWLSPMQIASGPQSVSENDEVIITIDKQFAFKSIKTKNLEIIQAARYIDNN